MHAFTRLTSFLLFVLSLGFLTCALPTPAVPGSNELAVRHDGPHDLLTLVADLHVQVQADVDVFGMPLPYFVLVDHPTDQLLPQLDLALSWKSRPRLT
jgi:hypothetical protein